jgi:hypothetical protein
MACYRDSFTLPPIISGEKYEVPHYEIFSIFLSIPPSWVQIFSSG